MVRAQRGEEVIRNSSAPGVVPEKAERLVSSQRF